MHHKTRIVVRMRQKRIGYQMAKKEIEDGYDDHARQQPAPMKPVEQHQADEKQKPNPDIEILEKRLDGFQPDSMNAQIGRSTDGQRRRDDSN